jgi:hypothetical protein
VTRISVVDLSHSAGPGGHSGVTHTTGKEITMVARLNFHDHAIARNFGKHLNLAGHAVTDSSLPAATQALVKIRASQINAEVRTGRRQPAG